MASDGLAPLGNNGLSFRFPQCALWSDCIAQHVGCTGVCHPNSLHHSLNKSLQLRRQNHTLSTIVELFVRAKHKVNIPFPNQWASVENRWISSQSNVRRARCHQERWLQMSSVGPSTTRHARYSSACIYYMIKCIRKNNSSAVVSKCQGGTVKCFPCRIVWAPPSVNTIVTRYDLQLPLQWRHMRVMALQSHDSGLLFGLTTKKSPKLLITDPFESVPSHEIITKSQ